MKKEQFKGSAQLLLATLIWGCAFVAQSVGMDHLGPMTFQAIRSLLAVLGLFLGKKCGIRVWISVLLAVGGLYLLSCVGVTKVNIGDLLILVSAGAFAVQIVLIDVLAQELDGIRLNCIQFIVVTVLSALAAAFTETPTWQGVIDCALPLVYTGVLSSGVAFTLQILGQQHLSPAPASLIMSLESVFAVLAGWVLLHQTLRPIEALGCALVFLAVILSQTKSN